MIKHTHTMKTQVHHNQIRQALIEKIGKKKVTASEAAKQIGISDATVSNIINESYAEKPALMPSDRMWMKIANWSGSRNGWRTADTVNYKRVFNVCRHAQDNSISRAISFSPGTGKTFALKAYANETPNCYYIECEEYFTKRTFLRELMQAIGLANNVMPMADMVGEIVARLNSTERPLVIIDEADKLDNGCLNLYKTLYNKTISGYVLTGTPYFKIKIDAGVKRNRMGYCEVYSRFGGEFIPLHPVDEKMVRQVCEVNGIEDEGEIQEVTEVAAGDLRRVKAMIERIQLRG